MSYLVGRGIAPCDIPSDVTFNYVWRHELFPKQLGKKYNRLGDCPICVLLAHIRNRPNKTETELRLIIQREMEHAKLHQYVKPDISYTYITSLTQINKKKKKKKKPKQKQKQKNLSTLSSLLLPLILDT